MLASRYRLSKNSEFQRIYRSGKRLRSQYLTIYWRATKYQDSHLAVVVTKKITKKATQRNRMRRQVYGVLQQQLTHLVGVNNIIVFIRQDITSLSAAQLNTYLVDQLKRAKLIQ